MNDNKGNTVSFRNTIIIFTTNLGCNKDTGKAKGLGFVKESASESTTKEINKAIENFFSPEFLGRLDDIIYYKALTKDIARTLVERYVSEYNNRSDINITFSEEDIEEAINNSEIETRGARGLRRSVRKQIIKVEDRLEDLA